MGGEGGTVAMPGGSGGEGGAPTGGACAGRGETYVAGISETGDGGWTVRITEADPAPPALDDNRWTVEVEDASGSPVEGATFEVDPDMPDHGHGTPIVAEVQDEGGGTYVLDPVNMFMPGFWTVDITITAPSGESDAVTFGFCVE
jgi:hypothetical protein